MTTPTPTTPGPDVTGVHVNDDDRYVTDYSDGTHSPPTPTADEALHRRQRARAIALQRFVKRKRRRWPIPRI